MTASPITHCQKAGHEYTPENTRILKNGKRTCRECERERQRNRVRDDPKRVSWKAEYDRNWISNRRAEFMADKACVKCGSTDKLELDHIDPAEKVSHRIWSWTEDKRLVEIAKCQILCHQCHLQKTHGWETNQLPHGRKMYEKHGCRCDTCVETVRERWRNKAAKERAAKKANKPDKF